MILTSLGIVLIIIGIIFLLKLDYFFRSMVCICTGIILIVCGTVIPIHGYEEPILSAEYELKPILSGSNVYIIQDRDDNITYNCAKKTKNSNSKSETKLYTHDGEFEIAIINETAKPLYREYLCKAKTSLFSFAWGCDKTQIEFCVPETGIVEWNDKIIENPENAE